MAIQTAPFLIQWPPLLARDRTWTWELVARTVSAGRSLSGAMPTVRMDGGGLWQATLGDVQVSTAAHLSVWRALSSILDGGAAPFVIEAVDPMLWPGVGNPAVAYCSDIAPVSDGVGFVSPVVSASLQIAASLRATELVIDIANASPLQAGAQFSIMHGVHSHRLYRIARVNQVGTEARVEIRPPLREATAAGTVIEFDRPKCVMQLAEPNAMSLALTRRRFGQGNVRLIERLPPFDGEEIASLAAP